MIKVLVEDYCHNCPEFEPDVHRESFRFDYSFIPEEKMNTTIYCVHKDRCRGIRAYLNDQKEKKDG